MSPRAARPSVSADEFQPGNREHELAAISALIRSGVLPAYRLSTLIEQVGSAIALVRLSEQDRLFSPSVAAHDVIGAVTPADLRKALVDVRAWTERGLDVRSVLDANYPESLQEIFNHPPLLFVEGTWPATRVRAIAVVGARHATEGGIRRARRLSAELARAGFVILSGLAKGIDTSAHRAALEAGGQTSAVMGTGLDFRYPRENADLADEIVRSGGALLSQFFPHQGPTSWTFPFRNVVMSGLSLATVVVEAGATSGARLQARVALEHGRTVFLLKSLVTSYEWARTYVEQGAYGTKAIEISSTEEIIDRLDVRHATQKISVA